ncbi:MAG: YcdB/YcdC domain-containing protein [Monoglobaceae bacterium]
MKKVKRAAALIAAMVMAWTFTSAYAAENSGLESAILSVKARVDIPAECTEFSSQTRSDDNTTVYQLEWRTNEDSDTQKSCSVSITDKGDIINYDVYEDGDNYYSSDVKFASFTAEEYINIAKEWLFNANPKWEAEMPSDKISCEKLNIYRETVSVTFERYINGLPFCGNSANVQIDKNSGAVAAMWASYTYADNIPSAGEAISEEEAEKKFLEASPMEIRYTENEDNKAVLIYAPKNAYYQIDAISGEKFDSFIYGYSSSGGGGSSNTKAEAAEDPGDLSEEEIENLEEIESLLSIEKLRAAAESIKNIGMEDMEYVSCSYVLQNSYMVRNKTDEPRSYTAKLRYAPKNNKDNYYGGLYIDLDAKNGELIRMYNNIYHKTDAEDEKPKVNYASAVQSAEDFIRNYGGEIIDSVKAPEDKDEDEENLLYYYLNFQRYENDIPFSQNYASVSVDGNTGYIKSYYKNWNADMEFESPDGIISPEQAGEILMDKVGLMLSYQKKAGESKTVPQIGMTYKLNSGNTYYIAAKSGECTDYSGNVYKVEEVRLPNDISGHYAEDRIKRLIESQALNLNGDAESFRPDDFITVAEFSEMMDTVFGRRIAVWASNKKDSSAIDSSSTTRETAAELMASAAGFGEAAKLKNIYVTGFEDESEIDADKLGSVAIIKGLGVMSGDENNYFNPKAMLTRADAAIMLYNYLAR